ncbi:site-specific integrase [Kribbella sp. NPDC050281]|uniref:site-specific integrase n=1 Tax=Kribbella sp. NPDC050281 TaxID=3155515 RepID=UPI0033D9444E
MLKAAWNRAGLLDAAGQPIYATAHDFRRMFVTEAVTAGLPIHIAAKLLGHASVNTTQAYHAVFQDDLVRSYRSFLDRRRAMRPTEEYREPTDAEWSEFQQHFHTRKLELGDCGRPLRNTLQTRTRLRSLPHAPGRPQTARPAHRHHPQPQRSSR